MAVFTTKLDQEVSRQFRASIATFATESSTTPPTTTTASMQQIAACLRLYSALNKPASAYAIYRELVVRPKVIQVCKRSTEIA